MVSVVSTSNANDVVEVTNDVGKLNGVVQGTPVVHVVINGADHQVDITNSSIHALSLANGTNTQITVTGLTISSINAGNTGSTFVFDEVNVTNGINLGTGGSTVNWTGGSINGGIVAGSGDDTLSFDDVDFSHSGYNFGDGVNEISFNNNTFQPNTQIVGGHGTNTFEISGDTTFGAGSLIYAGGGSSDELIVPDGSTITIGGTNYVVGTDPLPSGSNMSGAVGLPNGSNFNFYNFEAFDSSSPVCFATGTLINTPEGPVAVEDLKTGDHILTSESDTRELLWIGKIDLAFIEGNARHRPIEFKTGALAPGVPFPSLVVSPQHRILMQIEGSQEVLAPAKAFAGSPRVRICKSRRGIIYHALLLDQHSVIVANGAKVESFFPGTYGVGSLGPSFRRQVTKALRNSIGGEKLRARPFISVRAAPPVNTPCAPEGNGITPFPSARSLLAGYAISNLFFRYAMMSPDSYISTPASSSTR